MSQSAKRGVYNRARLAFTHEKFCVKSEVCEKKLPPQIRAIFGTAAYIKYNNAFLRRMRC